MTGIPSPYYEDMLPDRPERARVRFSATELLHLLGAVSLASLAFVLADATRDHPITARPFSFVLPDGPHLAGAVLAVTSGFVLHELAHKVVAQRYGHWAEFRAWFKMLLLTVPISLTGFTFLAPGAVMIRGRVTLKQNGVISLVGPATNFFIALLAWPLSVAVDRSAPLPTIMGIVCEINAFLCVFNLLPIGFLGNSLDGRKVLWWNKPVYFGVLTAAVALLVAILFS
ncbi:MAG: zinc metalloprotease [Thermoplasmatota archaeon]